MEAEPEGISLNKLIVRRLTSGGRSESHLQRQTLEAVLALGTKLDNLGQPRNLRPEGAKTSPAGAGKPSARAAIPRAAGKRSRKPGTTRAA